MQFAQKSQYLKIHKERHGNGARRSCLNTICIKLKESSGAEGRRKKVCANDMDQQQPVQRTQRKGREKIWSRRNERKKKRRERSKQQQQVQTQLARFISLNLMKFIDANCRARSDGRRTDQAESRKRGRRG